MVDWPSLSGSANLVYRDPVTGRLEYGSSGQDLYASFPSAGVFAAGIDDDTPGVLVAYGGGSGEAGGELRLHMEAAADGTYEYWRGYVPTGSTTLTFAAQGGSAALTITPAGVVAATLGSLGSGIADVTAGVVEAFGAGSASTVGGELRLHMAADHDPTDNYWSLAVSSDDLVVGLASSGARLTLTQEGQAQLAVQGSAGGILIGTDVHLFRGAANRLDLASGDSLNIVSGSLTVGGATTTTTISLTNSLSFGAGSALSSGTGVRGAADGDVFTSAVGSISWAIDAGNASTDEAFLWYNNAYEVAGTLIMALRDEGRLELPITGTTGGILLGGDALLYRSAADVIAIAAGDSLHAIGGTVNIGVEDTTQGAVHVFGSGTGSTAGALLRLYMAADHDATYDYWAVGVTQDSLTFSRTSTLMGQFDINGQWQLPIQGSTGGVLIGGDVSLYRGAANRLDLATGDTFNVVSGALQFAGTEVISSARAATLTGLTVNGNIIVTGTVDGEDVAGHVAATAAHGATGAVVGTTNAQTLTNKKLQDYSETVATNATSGAAATIDLDNGNVHEVTLTANCTFTFSNPPSSGSAGSFTLILRQNGTGGWTSTWPASVDWAAGTAPTLSTSANAVSVISFVTINGGTTWFGFSAGTGFA